MFLKERGSKVIVKGVKINSGLIVEVVPNTPKEIIGEILGNLKVIVRGISGKDG